MFWSGVQNGMDDSELWPHRGTTSVKSEEKIDQEEACAGANVVNMTEPSKLCEVKAEALK